MTLSVPPTTIYLFLKIALNVNHVSWTILRCYQLQSLETPCTASGAPYQRLEILVGLSDDLSTLYWSLVSRWLTITMDHHAIQRPVSIVFSTSYHQKILFRQWRRFITLFVTTKHTDASTQAQMMTTYDKHLYGVTGSTQRADALMVWPQDPPK